MKTKLWKMLLTTLEHCFEIGLLVKTDLPDFTLEVPNNPEHGHFAANLAMMLASSQRKSPLVIAKILLENLKDDENILESSEIAGPGFINFKIRSQEWRRVLSSVVESREHYGRNDTGNGKKILVEFVSANPTGPLHLGHGRGAALGDTLCRILSFCGYHVVREFYVNDAGQQIRMLGESVFARFKQKENPEYPFPEDGYKGEYIADLAEMISKETNLELFSEEEAVSTCMQKGKDIVLKEIKEDLERFRVSFDVWSSETDLYGSGLIESTLQTLSEKGQLYEEDGATWIRTSLFGDDKDRVIRKGGGQFTYFAADIAYHLQKFQKGYWKAINIWGADHHGYIPRVKAALSSHGVSPDWLSVVLIQLVKLWKEGEEVRMSKRTGNFVTLQELIGDVGVDAVRFVFLMKSHESPLDFDMDLVKKKDSDNPVYYVQYAHARICSIFRKAASEGIDLPSQTEGLSDHLVLEEEMALIRYIAGFSSLLNEISRSLEPHRLTYYLTDLAASFHKYFNMGSRNHEFRIITESTPLTRARLCLVDGIRVVLANGLDLLGISAPEKM
ncbi:MAG TPA: arginine--tRNA ligase [Deltaproteobacteria bacterium]|nr:arginine--tRNA ligase [Deltaproteobacteria bacterium]HIJ36044.1 arginine--tRNA ligase [Deltaproteobacteria bacterium]HIJ40158.1 arginine--tRNA ligase [Deltaproteobacteria bacterium]